MSAHRGSSVSHRYHWAGVLSGWHRCRTPMSWKMYLKGRVGEPAMGRRRRCGERKKRPVYARRQRVRRAGTPACC